jgi:hypothetical protein
VAKKNQLKDAPELVGWETAFATAQLGRVVHDSRGNAIWDWTIETAVLAQITAAELLDKLVDPIALGLESEAERTLSWCGDPYNRRR